MPESVRKAHILANRQKYEALKGSSEFIPYRPRDIVIGVYFNGQNDPQRCERLPADKAAMSGLVESCQVPLVVLNDCFDDGIDGHVRYQRVATGASPYLQRWFAIYEYLIRNPWIDRLWCVDTTDVEMLRNPFLNMNSVLYCGDENERVGCQWMVNHHKSPRMQEFIKRHSNRQLLNCGLFGGSRARVTEFIRAMIDAYEAEHHATFYQGRTAYGDLDMGLFNYVAYTKYGGKLFHGEPVNTVFKAMDRENKRAWWRHK